MADWRDRLGSSPSAVATLFLSQIKLAGKNPASAVSKCGNAKFMLTRRGDAFYTCRGKFPRVVATETNSAWRPFSRIIKHYEIYRPSVCIAVSVVAIGFVIRRLCAPPSPPRQGRCRIVR